MAIATKTEVKTASEVHQTQERRTSTAWFFFTTKWWETVSLQTMGNDIRVITTNEIRAVYVNGTEYLPPSKT